MSFITNSKLEFIKKSRPKIKIGDYFCFKINSAFYVGVVIQNQLIEKYGDNTMFSVLILNYSGKTIEEISLDKLVSTLKNRDLLISPINLNKVGWSRGFFSNIGNIDVNYLAKEVLEDCRFFYGAESIYNINYEETTKVSDLKLIGRTGIYNHLGLESLVQISLGLDFTAPNPEGYNPYEYYDELKTKYPNLELPFWYYKAKEKLKI